MGAVLVMRVYGVVCSVQVLIPFYLFPSLFFSLYLLPGRLHEVEMEEGDIVYYEVCAINRTCGPGANHTSGRATALLVHHY